MVVQGNHFSNLLNVCKTSELHQHMSFQFYWHWFCHISSLQMKWPLHQALSVVFLFGSFLEKVLLWATSVQFQDTASIQSTVPSGLLEVPGELNIDLVPCSRVQPSHENQIAWKFQCWVFFYQSHSSLPPDCVGLSPLQKESIMLIPSLSLCSCTSFSLKLSSPPSSCSTCPGTLIHMHALHFCFLIPMPLLLILVT